MDNSVTTKLVIKDETTRELARMQGVIDAFGNKIQSSFQKAGMAIAGYFSTQAIISFGKAAVSAASEAEEAEAKYVAMRKASNEATGVSIEQMKHLAAQLQRTTKHEDDNTIAVAANLLRYENMSKDVFPRVIRLAADMSDVFGSMSGAANMLGRGLNDPANASRLLKVAGVELDDAIKNQIKTFKESGEVGKAQELILKELEKRFGGLAEAMGDTFSGKVAKLTNQWGDVKESIGGALIPAIEKVLPMLDEFAKRFKATVDETADAISADDRPGPGGRKAPGKGWLPGTKGSLTNFLGGIANFDLIAQMPLQGIAGEGEGGGKIGAGSGTPFEKIMKMFGGKGDLAAAEFVEHFWQTIRGQRAERSGRLAGRNMAAFGVGLAERKEPAPEIDPYEQMFGGEGTSHMTTQAKDPRDLGGMVVDWDAVKARIKAEEELTKAAEQAAIDREKMRHEEFANFETSKPAKKDEFQATIESIQDVNKRITLGAASREAPEEKIVKATQAAGQKTAEAVDRMKDIMEGGVEAQEKAARSLEIIERQEIGLA